MQGYYKGYKSKKMFNKIKSNLLLKIFKSIYKPGAYYSTIPNPAFIEQEKEKIFKDEYPIPGIELHEQAQYDWLSSQASIIGEFPFHPDAGGKYRYYFNNPFFNQSDGLTLYTVIRSFQPKKIIEVGSGFSSALMLDVNEVFMSNSIHLTFIEPYPDRLYSLLSESDKQKASIKVNFIQNIPVSFFEQLGENDVLFIDSSHVSKVGSDLNYLLFQVLPTLKKGVIIHFHDILYPFEYPYDWFKMGISWNEAYLLRAFLMFNRSYEIMLFNSMIGKLGSEPLKSDFGQGGSIYLKKVN